MHTTLPEVEALKDIGSTLRQSNERDVNVQLERFRETLREFLLSQGAYRSTGGFANITHEIADIARAESKRWDDDYETAAEAFESIHDKVDRPYRSEE